MADAQLPPNNQYLHPCNDALRDYFGECPPEFGLYALQQVEWDWIDFRETVVPIDEESHAFWNERLAAHRRFCKYQCLNPKIELDDIENIIHPAGSGELLDTLKSSTDEAFSTIFRCLLSEAVNVQRIRAARLPRIARLCACKHHGRPPHRCHVTFWRPAGSYGTSQNHSQGGGVGGGQ